MASALDLTVAFRSAKPLAACDPAVFRQPFEGPEFDKIRVPGKSSTGGRIRL